MLQANSGCPAEPLAVTKAVSFSLGLVRPVSLCRDTELKGLFVQLVPWKLASVAACFCTVAVQSQPTACKLHVVLQLQVACSAA